MSAPRTEVDDRHPHARQSVARAGAPLDQAAVAVVLAHGRGADADGILALADELGGGDEVAYLAPQASGNTWYPLSFMAPVESNEPGLTSGLQRLGELVDEVISAGIPARHMVLAGFSQGACLTLEFAARHARRYGAVIGFTGGLIGPPGTKRDYPGDFEGTPVFLGSSMPDPHVPWERVEETAAVLERMGAAVDVRGYPGMPHTINAEELGAARTLLGRVLDGARDADDGVG